MSANLLSIIKQITAQYGEEVLNDARRLKALFSDLAKDEPKPLCMAFGKCVESGFYRAIKDTQTAEERREVIDTMARRLRDGEGLDLGLCTEALEVFTAALFGEDGIAPAPSVPEPAAVVTPAYYLSFNFRESGPFDLPTMERMIANGQITRAYYCRTSPAQEWTPAALFPEFAALFQATLFVQVKGGTFTMGSPANEAERWDDEVQHQVTVSGFSMGRYEVTQREWQEVMGDNPSCFKGDNLPVENVTWYDAVEYCNKRSQREGLTPAYTINGTDVSWNRNANGYRLPTEAEWEYACRAGTTTPFNTGNNITTSQANYAGYILPYNNNAKGVDREKTVDVGSFAANGWGLYDMHGNVEEWCWDWYGKYPNGAQSDPIGPPTGGSDQRVRRGGSWRDLGRNVRSSNRHCMTPSNSDNCLGFRLVRSP